MDISLSAWRYHGQERARGSRRETRVLPAYDATMLRGPLLSKASSRFVVAAMCSNAGAGDSSSSQRRRPRRRAPAASRARPTAFPPGIIGTGATPGGRGLGVKTHLAPSPYQALGLGGRSPPRRCCPVRHRRPGGSDRNSKRPHGIAESGVCASSRVPCVHRPPTSHARGCGRWRVAGAPTDTI